MRELLESIFGDAPAPERRIAIFTLPSRQTRLFSAYEPVSEYVAQQRDMQNIYFGLGLVAGQPAGRGRFADIAGIGCLWCDIDVACEAHAKPNLPQSVEEAHSLLRQMPLRPSAIVFSGHGLHAYWFLHEPWLFANDEDRQAAASLARRWHALVCHKAALRGWALENLGDLTRVLRLPGTLNHNGNRQPAEVRLVEIDNCVRYSADEFEEYLPAETEPAEACVGELVIRADAEPPAGKLMEMASSSPLFWQTWFRQRTDLADPSPSGYDMSLAAIAAKCGWSDQEIADLLIAFRRHHGEKPEKALRQDYLQRTIAKARQAAPDCAAVDLSNFVASEQEDNAEPSDPGELPVEMLRIPGFISEVMDFCLATAPYPNQAMAFGGALALQAFLAGRRVRDSGDNRTNLYILGLAHSAAGKDWVRKINTKILHHVGLEHCLGNRMASGEGIQEALNLNRAMLFQTDEIDGLLQSINKAKDARYESIMGTLLSLYSDSNSVFSMRPKANCPKPGAINQPHLVVFGTAIPSHYYEALNERMLTNGFFARMLILDSVNRGPGQEPSILTIPERILATAKWWANWFPGTGSGDGWIPIPVVIEHTEKARQLLAENRREVEGIYGKAVANNDAVSATVWGRANEQARKLALIYAVSENHLQPVIHEVAAKWAVQIVMHQCRRMLFMASQHVADNPFHALCLKLLKKLREAPEQSLPHSVLLKRMKIDIRTFNEVINTLLQRGDIEVLNLHTAGRPLQTYRLAHAGDAAQP